MKKIIILTLFAILILGGGYWLYSTSGNPLAPLTLVQEPDEIRLTRLITDYLTQQGQDYDYVTLISQTPVPGTEATLVAIETATAKSRNILVSRTPDGNLMIPQPGKESYCQLIEQAQLDSFEKEKLRVPCYEEADPLAPQPQ